jgi:hypothetical protein
LIEFSEGISKVRTFLWILAWMGLLAGFGLAVLWVAVWAVLHFVKLFPH